MPALFGLLLIAAAWPLRRWIGSRAAAAYAVFVLAAGHFLYFSRFIREDLYSLVFTLATILAFQRFLETDRAAWLTASAVAFALAGVTKENAYMTGVLFVVWGVWSLVERASRRGEPRPGLGPAFSDTFAWVRARFLPIVAAGLVFLSIWALMYTAFGKYPGDWLAIPKAITYWMGQHSIARIPGPWWYYFPQLAYYETAILLAAAFAFRPVEWKGDPFLRTVMVGAPLTLAYLVARTYAAPLRAHALYWLLGIAAVTVYVALFRLGGPGEHRLTPFVRFVAYWAVGSLAIYGWAREKVPWLTVHPLLPLTILAAIGFTRVWERRGEGWARAALAVGAALFAVNTYGAYLAAFRYGAHDLEGEPKHAEMLAYVQTTKDLVRSLSSVARAQSRVAPGAPVVTVAGEGVWPLSWYLRDVPVTWAQRIEQASTPVIVADWDPEGALEKQLASAYDAKRVPIRGWWFPEVHKDEAKDGKPGATHPTVRDFLRWWLFHEIWSPIGSQDATMYVRKDIAGGTGTLEPLQIAVQDTSRATTPPRRSRFRLHASSGRARPAACASRAGSRRTPRATSTSRTRRTAASSSSTATATSFAPSEAPARATASSRSRAASPSARTVSSMSRTRGTTASRASRRTASGAAPGWRPTRASSVRARSSSRAASSTSRTPATSGSSASTRTGRSPERSAAPARSPADSSSRSGSPPTPPDGSTSPTRATIASRSSRRTARSSASSRCTAGRTSTRSRTSRRGRRTASS
jgi:uncharacterized protein (TIGR03663 family)